MTLLVVPKSIPATDARPRKPILAMRPNPRIANPINEGNKASTPPEGPSAPCFFNELDFFFAFLVVMVVVTTVSRRASNTYSPSLSRFLLRDRTFRSFLVSPDFKHIVQPTMRTFQLAKEPEMQRVSLLGW